VAALEVAPDRFDGRDEARITRFDEAQVGEQQQRGVEALAAERIGEMAELGIPGFGEDARADRVGAQPPVRDAFLEAAEPRRDPREPVARGPAHHRRIRVHVRAAAEFPQSCVRLVVQHPGLVAQRLEPLEHRHVARLPQALVEEQLRRGEHHAAVHVVLLLQPGQVAAPHRAHAAIAGEVRHVLFGELALEADAVHRLQFGFVGGDEVEDVADVFLHRARRAEAVERADHEGGVAQPAVAVIPVALRARRFRDGRRERGDDAARVLVLAQLERDRAADHRILPFQGQREVARPFEPVVLGLAPRVVDEALDRAGQRLVRAEHEAQLAFQHERQAVADQPKRRVGGQAQGHARQQEAQVVAAPGVFRRARAPVRQRAQADPHTRVAGERAHGAHQHHRPVEAAVLAPARREVDLFDRAAVAVVEHRAQDRGVADVMLLGMGEVLEFDRPVAAFEFRLEQCAERGVPVESGQAAPDDAAAAVEQCAEAAVADQAEVQRVGGFRIVRGRVVHPVAPSAAPSASQRRTALGLRSA
jgi:hypothetical protein